MLTDEAKKVIARRQQERQERWDGKRPLVDPRLGASKLTLDDVRPGYEIWARLGVDGLMRAGEGDWEYEGVDPRGGIVLEETRISRVDETTGEFVNERAFRCWDYTVDFHGALVTVGESQVDPTRVGPPIEKRIWRQWRRLAGWVGDQAGRPSRRELLIVEVVRQLAAIEATKR